MHDTEKDFLAEEHRRRQVRNLTIFFFLAFIAIGMAYCRFLQTYPTPDLKLGDFERKTFGLFQPPAVDSLEQDSLMEKAPGPASGRVDAGKSDKKDGE